MAARGGYRDMLTVVVEVPHDGGMVQFLNAECSSFISHVQSILFEKFCQHE